jgi:hypothetical protein
VREFADPPSPTRRRGKQRSEVRSHFEAQQYKTGPLCFQIASKKTKRLTASIISIRQALNC